MHSIKDSHTPAKKEADNRSASGAKACKVYITHPSGQRFRLRRRGVQALHNPTPAGDGFASGGEERKR